jgi:hypothetical protein
VSRRCVGYELLHNWDAEVLARGVQAYIADGWEPHGQPFIGPDSDSSAYRYCQAVARWVEELGRETLTGGPMLFPPNPPFPQPYGPLTIPTSPSTGTPPPDVAPSTVSEVSDRPLEPLS